MSSGKTKDTGFGDFMGPVIDLFSEILLKLVELATKGIIYGVNKYLFKKQSESEIKKIERSDIKNRKSTLDEEALGFSVTRKKNLPLSELNRKKHTLICGASGFGKSVLIDTLMYDDMRNNKPVIFIDPKGDGECIAQFINLCRITGRDFGIFSEYYDGAGAICLNPVKDGSATQIADRIHYSFTWSEEHYEVLCYRALKKACTLLKAENAEVTYKRILDKLNEISNPKDKERFIERSNIEGIISRIENIVESDFGKKLDRGMSFSEVWKSKKCIYIGMPVLGYPKIARSLGKIVLGDLAYTVYDSYKLYEEGLLIKSPIGVYIDELSAVITDEFIELLNKCRKVGMELTIAFQTPSDINKVDPSLCEQILENTSNWFALKQRMESGANTFSEAIGTVSTKKKTIRVERGEEKDQGSQREVEELIAHHNIIKNLNEGQAVLLQHAPTRVDLLNLKYLDPKVVSANVKFLEKEGYIKINTPVKKEEKSEGAL